MEKLANFDRERIPERVVHARGASAKGFFEVTHDITHLSCADFLRAPGVQTPVIVRFSTVIHERGGALVTTPAAARQNAALPRVGRWCWWLKEVEVMA